MSTTTDEQLEEYDVIRQMRRLREAHRYIGWLRHVPPIIVLAVSRVVGWFAGLPIAWQVMRARLFRTRSEYAQRVGQVINLFGVHNLAVRSLGQLLDRQKEYFGREYPADLFYLLLKLEDHRVQRRIIGLEALRERLNAVGPAVLAMPNLGPSPLLPPLLAAVGVDVGTITLGAEATGLERLLARYAPDANRRIAKYVLEDRRTLLRAAVAVRRGQALCMYPEFVPYETDTPMTSVQFLSGRIRVPLGLATLASRLKVPVIPVALVSRGRGRFEAVLGETVDPISSGADGVADLCQAVFSGTAELVRRFPEQWMGWYLYVNFPQHGPWPAWTAENEAASTSARAVG
jgi:lauroyl/myristoyl acyltransferase